MRYLSVCSGIEAATAAWHHLGWEPAAFSEIEKFPSAVLAHHYPTIPNLGDFTTIKVSDVGSIDLLVGGTPCQSFSIAGLRGGLDDDRGNLALEFLRLADRTGAKWVVWENVPGVLSSNEGRDFGAILGGLVELGYGFAYRVLDAQYVRTQRFPWAVPQRRRRVFLVGYLGDARRAAAVLFERESLCGDTPPSRETRQDVAGTVTSRVGNGSRPAGGHGNLAVAMQETVATLDANYGRLQGCSGQDMSHGHSHLVAFGGNKTSGPIDVATACNAHGGDSRHDFESETFIAFSSKDHGEDAQSNVTPTLRAMNHSGSHANAGGQLAVAFDTKQITSKDNRSNPQPNDPCHPLSSSAHPPALANEMAVRRLTPRECERLQGFDDDYTQIEWRGRSIEDCPDGPRYKALGNSMAVNCMDWIGQRIQQVSQAQ